MMPAHHLLAAHVGFEIKVGGRRNNVLIHQIIDELTS
jgi:hypothetical protein